MRESVHYTYERVARQENINRIGLGNVIYTTIRFDEKRQRTFRYEITDTAVLIVKATDDELIITKMVARPKRIRQYWEDAPQEIIQLAVEHTRAGMWV